MLPFASAGYQLPSAIVAAATASCLPLDERHEIRILAIHLCLEPIDLALKALEGGDAIGVGGGVIAVTSAAASAATAAAAAI